MKKKQQDGDDYKKNLMVIISIITISILLMVAVYFVKIKPVAVSPVVIGGSSVSNTSESTAIHTGEKLEQIFTIPEVATKGITFEFGQSNQNGGGVIEIAIFDDVTGTLIEEKTIHVSENENLEEYQWMFFNGLQLNPNTTYRLVMQVNMDDANNGVVFALSDQKQVSEWHLGINEEIQPTNLKINLLGDRGIFLSFIYWCIALSIIAFLALMYFLIVMKKMKTEKIFLIAILFLGLVYMGGLFSPYSGYDEPAHFDTAYRYSNVLMGKGYGTADDKGYGIYLRRVEDSAEGLTPAKTKIENIELVAKDFFKLSENSELIEVQGRSVKTMPYLYLPSAIGIAIARLLNLGRIPLFLLGRFFNLLAFTALTYFSIKKMPFGKNILFSISMLPLLIEQVSSFSYDTLIVGLAFLFIAQCLYMAFSKNKLKKIDSITLFISGILLAPCKAVYILICLCVFLIPKERFSSPQKHRLFLVSFFLAVCISYIIFSLSSVLIHVSTTTQMAAFVEKPAYQFSFVYEQPLKFLKLLFNSFLVTFDSFFLMSFNMLYLVPLPVFLGIGYMILIVLSSLKVVEEPLYVTHQNKRLFLIVSVLLILALYTVGVIMTVEGSEVIQGVQGRYLLPAMPIIALLFRNRVIVLQKNIDQYILFGGCVLEVVTVVLTFISMIEG